MVLPDVSRWDANIQVTRQDALDLFSTVVSCSFHVVMLLQPSFVE